MNPCGAAELAAVGPSLSAALGTEVLATPAQPIGGGCIATCYRVMTATGPVFLKLVPMPQLPLLEAERAGLQALAATHTLRVPRPLALGCCDTAAFLALEWIDFGAAARESDIRLGRALAQLHRCSGPAFGLGVDNFIGRTPQPNGWSQDWVSFLRERRLGFQLERAAGNGHGGALQARGQHLLQHLELFFGSYRPVPSLLHGDLWGGNCAVAAGGQPVLFDPAVYFGDREAELAMTGLFGGFSAGFYAAYAEEWPLDADAGLRRDLYNLYHVLNHLNLFGGAYRGQAEDMIARLLATIGH